MIRGELWLVAGGVYASKPRPAVILQDDRFDATDSVTVVPLTTTDLSAPLLRVSIAANEHNGLDLDSFVMIDKLTTVRRAQVTTRVGRLSTEQVVDVERLIMVFLGLAD
ncbi:type II toxin-antitoxin system PemK/MazF family toxin [Cryobacterium sp. TMT1-3]|uniref:Type II toxin-antitoxin system PemK/MazF family toxin n=1 Tax=Cryobacterium luteum TaxID=1424661 RepID=A0A1H8FSD9_9MICO|nr:MULTISPECIES: type II toxin-antitoxin system PemK/MazF family toxin [Cryobacterium]TFB93457.1 type II toxin-antitoxin system PemK/MazF family toxin [Cryobacterium luteum]TFC28889.1 type II toxin-antitoxin system PemK/MazF family toxin [Cryobacterium sp. TMT1-3]SEN34711.1 mRNA interferase MazF [Cryobacterium luteum]